MTRLAAPEAALAFVPYPFFVQHGNDLHLAPLGQADVQPAGVQQRWTLVLQQGHAPARTTVFVTHDQMQVIRLVFDRDPTPAAAHGARIATASSPSHVTVEGASIDKQSHPNQAAGTIWDTIEFDKAVGALKSSKLGARGRDDSGRRATSRAACGRCRSGPTRGWA